MICRLFLAGLLVFALASFLPAAATPATPSSGSLSPTQTSLTWTGQSYTLGSTLDPALCPPPAADPNNAVCDHFQLTVDADAAYWQANPGGVTVTISWPDPSNDFDLYLFDASGNQVAASAGTSDPEQATIPERPGHVRRDGGAVLGRKLRLRRHGRDPRTRRRARSSAGARARTTVRRSQARTPRSRPRIRRSGTRGHS